jgi:signal recognition particle subunit SRP54
MFENLQDKLERAFKTLKGEGTITELNVAATMKEVRRALVDADVNYKIAKEFTDTIKDKALGQADQYRIAKSSRFSRSIANCF